MARSKGWFPRLLAATGRGLLWFVIILVGWWFLSAMFPGLPGPASAAKSLLGVVKSTSDDLYFWAEIGRAHV